MRHMNRHTLATELVMMVRHRNRRPLLSVSETKSILHRSFGPLSASRIGRGAWLLRFLLLARRALLPCRVVELASGLPTGLRVEASHGSSGSPSAAAPALTPRCELVKAPGDREYCDIASCTDRSETPRTACTWRPGAVPGPSVSQQVLQNLKIQCLVATIRFSRRFSSSTCFKRLASFTSIPPYFVPHR